MSYPCPCCGYLTFEEINGSYEICHVCYWEDDPIQNSDLNFVGGANEVCLNRAKENFLTFKAIEKRFISLVSVPRADEIPKD